MDIYVHIHVGAISGPAALQARGPAAAGDIHAARLAAGRWGAELAGGCDRWVDLSALTDADAAKRILGERVDVLVDLNGQSKGGRPGILLRFPAPVRLSFLGFPASVGGAADYTGADARAAPPEYQVCMHGSVQCMRACVCGWMS